MMVTGGGGFQGAAVVRRLSSAVMTESSSRAAPVGETHLVRDLCDVAFGLVGLAWNM